MRWGSWLAALVVLALLGALVATPRLTDPPPFRAQAQGFDAARAKARLARLLGDQSPHPADSAANDAVRDRLVAMLHGMGLDPIVRDQFACNALFKQRGVSCARVRNVIAMLGPPGGKALLISAHYDSTPYGPGAGDAGVGVATMLEVAHLLKDRPLARPVVLLFNEGEELGLVGARAFLDDPLSRRIDSLINLEARGVSGPVNMFETDRPNGAAIAAFAATAGRPIANSLSTDVYRLMPNYTDVNSFGTRGWLTLNFAPIGNETRYHSPGDDIAALSPATLQHMGDQLLALAQHLAAGRPPERGAVIFGDLAGRWLLVMPLVAGIIMLGLAIAGLAFASLRRGRPGRALAMTVAALGSSAALAWLALAAIGALRRGMFWRGHPEWSLAAIYAGAILAAALLLATLGRRADVRQLRAGYWLGFALIGAGMGLAAPGGIVFFIVPALIVLAGIGAARWWPWAERAGAWLAILWLYLTWGGMLGLLRELLSNGPLWVFAPLALLIAMPVLIELRAAGGRGALRAGAGVAGVATVALWLGAALAPAYSADRQQRFAIQHVSDSASGRAWWSVINDGARLPPGYRPLEPWTRGKLPIGQRPRWLAKAPRIAADAPRATLVERRSSGSERSVTLRLASRGWDAVYLIAPADAQLRAAGAGGSVRAIDQSDPGLYAVACFGRSCEGAELTLVLGRRSPVPLILVGSRAGLPAAAKPLLGARPRSARPQYGRDETLSFVRLKV